MSTVSTHPDRALHGGKGEAITRIGPGLALQSLSPAVLWRYRELAWSLAKRDFSVRYRQTCLGTLWAVIQPLVSMVVLHVFFGKAMGLEDRVGGVAYPIFLFAGLLPWNLFTTTITSSTQSLIANQHILTKVYFPRILLPISAATVPLVDFALALVVLFGLMVFLGVSFSVSLLALPVALLGALLSAVGVGLALSALTVWYRDTRHALPFVMQTWFFMTPVLYPPAILPEGYRWLLMLNPMTGVIDAFRAAILDQPMTMSTLMMPVAIGSLLMVVGAVIFTRAERSFADVI
ncbi:ABC transporter permease [Mucisphaera calidilacus]|uniref:Transport permease protein n=1 Tax=Mucisphaera calidilacus TaxID=2527982 RepID=A0A518BZ38_9BACT|nr:ABC transporter permease [Mucisphaera calidilacus]QDU72224.1 Teichoic acid translocation permease protein TagG [Mucisphaera calidilacus]